MGKKTLKKHHRPKPSPVSKITHSVEAFFKEAVQAPPEPQESKTSEEIQTPAQETTRTETLVDQETEKEPPVEEQDERRDEILGKLNHATQQWKDSGDIGLTLKAPIPFRERVKTVLSYVKSGSIKVGSAVKIGSITACGLVKENSIKLGSAVKQQTQNAAERIRKTREEHRAQPPTPTPAIAEKQTIQTPAPHTPKKEPPDTIQQEWQEVVEKTTSADADRDEVDQLIEELSQEKK